MRKIVPFGGRLQGKLKDKGFARMYYNELNRLRLAHQIIELRKRRGLSQEKLAQKIGTTQSGIARMEDSDYMGYSLPSLLKIAIALDAELNIQLTPRHIR